MNPTRPVPSCEDGEPRVQMYLRKDLVLRPRVSVCRFQRTRRSCGVPPHCVYMQWLGPNKRSLHRISKTKLPIHCKALTHVW